MKRLGSLARDIAGWLLVVGWFFFNLRRLRAELDRANGEEL